MRRYIGIPTDLVTDGQHRATGNAVPVRLLYSARTVDDVIGRAELHQPAAGQVNVPLTRGAPAGWTGLTGRVDATLLAVGALIDLGHDPGRIKTERFGGTGGP